MEIKQERSGSAVVLHLSGEFGGSVPEFDDLLMRLVRESDADIIVDVSGVSDFRALNPLVLAERLRRDQGGMHRLAIVAAPGSSTSERFMINGMRKVIPIFGTIEEVRGAWETDGFPA